MLAKDQKKSMFDISKYHLSLYEDDSKEFISSRIITQDATLVNHFDPEAKKQTRNRSTLAHHPAPTSH